jgi:A/G-specific adenine glycosylase
MPKQRPGDFNQALMELGAVVCLPNGEPKCGLCPWAPNCAALQEGWLAQLPVKQPKKPRKIEERNLMILRCGDCVALRRRPAKGLLAGLWELPEAFELPACHVLSTQDIGQAVHIFTHKEWRMHAVRVILDVKLEGFTWVTREDLEHDFALPSAFTPFRGAMFP